MQAGVSTPCKNWPQGLPQNSVELHWKFARVAFVNNPVRCFPISHVFPHDYQPYLAPLRSMITGTESSGINAMRHIDHLIKPKPAPEIFKLAPRYHYGRVDSCEQVLLQSFEAIRHTESWHVK